jgi:crotonobetainyl-CoA:carnitine CoA-transferase CaiB-like acyl-CoA transferase
MKQVFAGVRVLDFTTTIAGPHCTRLLADLGAEVIKIEPPDGDMMRTRLPLRNGASSYFGQLNAGKKSIVLDLKTQSAVAAVKTLVTESDVVVENFRPGVMLRLGLDYPVLARINPRLVFCAISGYGQTGPSSSLPAYAPVIHAASGYDLAHLAYQPDRIRPDNCGIFIADVLAGAYAFAAIAAALHQRTDTGLGQFIDVSMLESMLSLTLSELQTAQFEVAAAGRPIYGPAATADGYIMMAVASERTFQGLAATAGRTDWLHDKRFATFAERHKNWDALMDEFEAWSTRCSTADCLTALDANGVPASSYRTVRQALGDPQLAHRQALTEVEDTGGTFKALNPPFRMSGSATVAGARAPALGEHTQAVLQQISLAD